MNLPYFIAKRISDPGENNFSSIIHRIAIASVALGLAIMVVSFLILGGFQDNIKDKIFSFSGHIQLKKFSLSNSYEEEPFIVEDWRYEALKNDEYVKHVQEFAHKPGLLSKDDDVYGVLFKGINESFDPGLFEKYIVEGEFLTFPDSVASRDVLISDRLAKSLNIEVGERVVVHFIMDPPKVRGLNVVGIFKTALDTFDEQVIIGDLDVVRSLNGWTDEQIGGMEIFVNDLSRLEEADDSIIQKISVSQFTERVDDKYLQIFDWLNLLNQNVYIFLGLILFVAAFNMVSVLFILIMERTQMIGTFKALGATNQLIRRIFSLNGFRLVLKGMLIGNLIGLGFGALQYYFRIIPLDPQNYYMEYVPIEWNWGITLLLNLSTLLLVGLVLTLPTVIISRIRPVKAIRFD